MKEPGLDHRHRDKDGEISRKHGNTHVGTLREHCSAQLRAGLQGHRHSGACSCETRRAVAEQAGERSRGRPFGRAYRETFVGTLGCGPTGAMKAKV